MTPLTPSDSASPSKGLSSLFAYALLTMLAFTPVGRAASEEGRELIGERAPEWRVANWLNSEPLTLESLRGKGVLVRWWTAPNCPYCAASAPALNEFHELYRNKGLVTIGFYHHKSGAPLNPKDVEKFAREFGFEFPVAIDPEWQTLREWWLEERPRAWTSVTFLLDRDGIIRHIHPGGAYEKGDSDYNLLRRKIEELLTSPL